VERRGQLDSPGPTRVVFLIICALLIIVSTQAARADTASARDARIKALIDQHRWNEVVREVEREADRDADLYYYYGTALAQLNRWDEAKAAFLAGRHLAPQDARFPVELGGVAFKQKRYAEAAKWVRRGLRLDPSDNYANDFLGTIYFLQGNLEAALKHWNRIDKPKIQNVNVEPGLHVSPALLDRAFAFSPAAVLRESDLLTSQARVDALGIFPTHRFELAAREDGSFDLNYRAHELNGFGANKWAALLSALRGLPYETVYIDYFNARGSALNAGAMVRWDDQKRRLTATISTPLEHNPKYRWALGADLRNELWGLRSTFDSPTFAGLNLRREAVTGSLTSFGGRLTWSLGGELSDRQFRTTAVPPNLLPFILPAYQLKQTSTLRYALWRIPERRSVVTTAVSAETGAIWSTPNHNFEKLQASAQWHWFPQISGDDYAIREEIRAGKTFGTVPFDELFMLGLERDNDLWLRAHIGTRNGLKGSAPLGRNYFLSNWDLDKNIYNNGLFGIKLTPLLDIAKITDPSKVLGSHQWLFDTGIQLKFSVLGVGIVFTYGKDLRTGNNAFYATTER